jgi:hypothetical protein
MCGFRLRLRLPSSPSATPDKTPDKSIPTHGTIIITVTVTEVMLKFRPEGKVKKCPASVAETSGHTYGAEYGIDGQTYSSSEKTFLR